MSHYGFNLHFLHDVEHLFICVFAIHSPLVKYLLKSLDYFLSKAFCFLTMNFESSLHILDIYPLSGT